MSFPKRALRNKVTLTSTALFLISSVTSTAYAGAFGGFKSEYVVVRNSGESTEICDYDPLPRDVARAIRRSANFDEIVAYMADNCPDLLLELTNTATASIGGPTSTQEDFSEGDDDLPGGGGPGDGGPGDDGPGDDGPGDDGPGDDGPGDDGPGDDGPGDDGPGDDGPGDDGPGDDKPGDDGPGGPGGPGDGGPGDDKPGKDD